MTRALVVLWGHVDRTVQRVVDAIVIWWLRRGVPKSTQIYVGVAVHVCLFMLLAWVSVTQDDAKWWSLVLCGCFAAFLVWFAGLRRRQIMIEEARGMAPQPMSPVWRGYTIVIVLCDAGGAAWSGRGTDVILLACAGVWLLVIYAIGSPHTPPAQTVTVPAVPAHTVSR